MQKKEFVENMSNILLRELYLNICSEVYFEKELVQKDILSRTYVIFRNQCGGEKTPSLYFKAPKILDRPHLLYTFVIYFTL
jgi:hypothetical protein